MISIGRGRAFYGGGNHGLSQHWKEINQISAFGSAAINNKWIEGQRCNSPTNYSNQSFLFQVMDFSHNIDLIKREKLCKLRFAESDCMSLEWTQHCLCIVKCQAKYDLQLLPHVGGIGTVAGVFFRTNYLPRDPKQLDKGTTSKSNCLTKPTQSKNTKYNFVGVYRYGWLCSASEKC